MAHTTERWSYVCHTSSTGVRPGGAGLDHCWVRVGSRLICENRFAALAVDPPLQLGPRLVPPPRDRLLVPLDRAGDRDLRVHLGRLSNRDTCLLLYEVSNSWRMTPAARPQVQTSSRKPYALASCQRESGIRCNCSGVSLGAAPRRSAWEARISRPPRREAAIHRLAALSVAPAGAAIQRRANPVDGASTTAATPASHENEANRPCPTDGAGHVDEHAGPRGPAGHKRPCPTDGAGHLSYLCTTQQDLVSALLAALAFRLGSLPPRPITAGPVAASSIFG